MSAKNPNHGGPRPGAGRKPKIVEDATHSVLAEIFDAAAERKVVKAMVDAVVQDRSVPAATWLWDRKYGKPKERIEHSGDSEQPITIVSHSVDYRAAVAALAPGSVGDSDASGESEGP